MQSTHPVRAARVARQWSQERLAREVGVSRETIRQIEAGRTDPRMGTARALADALGLPIDELFPGEAA